MVVEGGWLHASKLVGGAFHLDAIQAYVMVRRFFVEAGDVQRKDEKVLSIAVKEYFKERQALLQCLIALLRMGESAGCLDSYERPSEQDHRNAKEDVEWMLEHGLEKNLRAQVVETLESITAVTTIQSPSSAMVGMSATCTGALRIPDEALSQGHGENLTAWMDEMAIELALLLEALFLLHYQVTKQRTMTAGQLQQLASTFLKHLFVELHASSPMQREQMRWAQDLGILVLLECMQVEEALDSLSQGENLGVVEHPLLADSAVGALDSVFEEFHRTLLKKHSTPYLHDSCALPLMAWGALCVLGKDKQGQEVGLLQGKAGYEHGALQRMSQLLNCAELQGADMQVSGYKSVCKNILSCIIAAFDFKVPNMPQIHLDSMIDCLCRVFQGEEDIAEQFWSCVYGMQDGAALPGIDFPIVQFVDELKTMLTCYPGPISKVLAPLARGPYLASRALHFLEETVCITTLHGIDEEWITMNRDESVSAAKNIPLNNASGIQVPEGAMGHVLAESVKGSQRMIRWDVRLPEKSGLILLCSWIRSTHIDVETLHSILSFLTSLAQSRDYDVCTALLEMKLPSLDAGRSSSSKALLQAAADAASARSKPSGSALALVGEVLRLSAALARYNPQLVFAIVDSMALLSTTQSHSTNPQQLLQQGLTGGMQGMHLVFQEERLLGTYQATLGLLDLTSSLLERGMRGSSLTVWLGHLLGTLIFSGMLGKWKYVVRRQRWELVAGCFRCIRFALKLASSQDLLRLALEQYLLKDHSTSAAVLSSITLDAVALERLQEYSPRRAEGLALETAVKELLQMVPVCMAASNSIPAQQASAWEQVLFSPHEDSFDPPVTLLCTYITYRFDKAISFQALECFYAVVALSSKTRQRQPLLASMLVSDSCSRIKSFFSDALSAKSALHSPVLFSSAARVLLACMEGENSLSEFFLFPSSLESSNEQRLNDNSFGPDSLSSGATQKRAKDRGCLDSLHSCLEKAKELRQSQPRSLTWLMRLICAMAADPIQLGHPNQILSSQSAFLDRVSECFPEADADSQSPGTLEHEIFRFAAEATALQTLAAYAFRAESWSALPTSQPVSDLISKWWKEDRIRSWLSMYAHNEYDASAHAVAREALGALVLHILDLLHDSRGYAVESMHRSVAEKLLDAKANARFDVSISEEDLLNCSGCIPQGFAALLRDYGESFMYDCDSLSSSLGPGLSEDKFLKEAIHALKGASLEASLADVKLQALKGLRAVLTHYSPPLMRAEDSFLVTGAAPAVSMACAAVALYECVSAVQQKQVLQSSTDSGLLTANASELSKFALMFARAWISSKPSREQQDALAEASVFAARQAVDACLTGVAWAMPLQSEHSKLDDEECLQSLLATALMLLRGAARAAGRAAQEILPCCCALLAQIGSGQRCVSDGTLQAIAAMASSSIDLCGLDCIGNVGFFTCLPHLLLRKGSSSSAIAGFMLMVATSSFGAQALTDHGLWDILDERSRRQGWQVMELGLEYTVAGQVSNHPAESSNDDWMETMSLVTALSSHPFLETKVVTWLSAHGHCVQASVDKPFNDLAKPASLLTLKESATALALLCAVSRFRGAWQLAAPESFQSCRSSSRNSLLAVAALSVSSVGNTLHTLHFKDTGTDPELDSGPSESKPADTSEVARLTWARGAYQVARNNIGNIGAALDMARCAFLVARHAAHFFVATAVPASERFGPSELWGKGTLAVEALRTDCDLMLKTTQGSIATDDVIVITSLARVLHDIHGASTVS